MGGQGVSCNLLRGNPPVNRQNDGQTDTTENIALPQTTYVDVDNPCFC